jgi:phage gp36-like protein
LVDIKLQIYEDELIRLTDEAGTGIIDATKVDTAIETAGVEIDAYLGEQYTLPLPTTLPIITKLAVDLAIRNLYLLNAGGIPDSRETQAKNAIRMLEKISEGKLTLGVGDPQAGSSDHGVHIVSSPRVFSRDKLKGF